MKRFLLYVILSMAIAFLVFGFGGDLRDFPPSEYWMILLLGAGIGALVWLGDMQWEWIRSLSRRQSDDD